MSDDSRPPSIRVVGGTPTDEETAAITAVFTRIALERAASSLPLPAGTSQDGWERSTRALRDPLRRSGTWQER